MSSTPGTPQPTPVGFLTAADEMSLADSRAQLSADSMPDTLEVRADSMSLVQDELETWRRPLQLALAAVAVGVIALLGGAAMSRRGKQAS